MAISVVCSACGQRYKLRDELAGKKARCRCGQTMTIPVAEAPPLLPELLDESLFDAPAAEPTLAPVGPALPAARGKRRSGAKGPSPTMLFALAGGGVVALCFSSAC